MKEFFPEKDTKLPKIDEAASTLSSIATIFRRKADIQKKIKVLRSEESALDRIILATGENKLEDLQDMVSDIIEQIRSSQDTLPCERK